MVPNQQPVKLNGVLSNSLRILGLILALLSLQGLVAAPASRAEDRFEPGEVVVRYKPGFEPKGVESSQPLVVNTDSVQDSVRELKQMEGVAYAVPNMIAHASTDGRHGFFPNDPELMVKQWNLIGPYGINTPEAWLALREGGKEGGRGVVVAVLDTGVAYINRRPYKRSPDFRSRQFARGYDYVQDDRNPSDRNGHGTHVAGTIAEATDNGIGAAGVAYGAQIMPVRVLDSYGEGNASDIARGIKSAVTQGADLINLSLEFDSSVKAKDIPQVIDALRFARQRSVAVIAATGNEGTGRISYPARSELVIAVGSSTEGGCRSEFSNYGEGLDLVAPGGGLDARLPDDPRCSASALGRSIYQVTLIKKNLQRFGLPAGYEGTSMAAPHVTGVAALLLASGILGNKPSPDLLAQRLKQTSRDLGRPGPDRHYGWGLVDAAKAINASN